MGERNTSREVGRLHVEEKHFMTAELLAMLHCMIWNRSIVFSATDDLDCYNSLASTIERWWFLGA